MDGSDDRAARLAAQLRANLRRRKEQARDQRDGPASAVPVPRPADRD